MEENFIYEVVRLRSFVNWPKENIVSAADLAREGFYYTKLDDKVKCAFCDLILTEWEPGDTPNDQHRKWYPNCPFLRGSNTGNIRIPTESVEHVAGGLQISKTINSKLVSKVRCDSIH